MGVGAHRLSMRTFQSRMALGPWHARFSWPSLLSLFSRVTWVALQYTHIHITYDIHTMNFTEKCSNNY